jgi:hypothetical protein
MTVLIKNSHVPHSEFIKGSPISKALVKWAQSTVPFVSSERDKCSDDVFLARPLA